MNLVCFHIVFLYLSIQIHLILPVSCVDNWSLVYFFGSFVSKDGWSDISRILMPSPSHCRVMSQDPSSRSCYPPLRGIRSRSSQQSVFGSANATDWATGEGLINDYTILYDLKNASNIDIALILILKLTWYCVQQDNQPWWRCVLQKSGFLQQRSCSGLGNEVFIQYCLFFI